MLLRPIDRGKFVKKFKGEKMNDLEKEIKESSAFKLACEANRLLSLAEEDDPRLIGLSDVKKLLYVEDELKTRAGRLLPGLPKVISSQTKDEEEMGSNPHYINEILGHYRKRKTKAPEKQLRFYVKIRNNLNSTVAVIPVMAVDKKDAKTAAEKKSAKLGLKNLTFEIG